MVSPLGSPNNARCCAKAQQNKKRNSLTSPCLTRKAWIHMIGQTNNTRLWRRLCSHMHTWPQAPSLGQKVLKRRQQTTWTPCYLMTQTSKPGQPMRRYSELAVLTGAPACFLSRHPPAWVGCQRACFLSRHSPAWAGYQRSCFLSQHSSA